MDNNKLLTIAIPTYNRCGCLELLLESIAGQYEEIRGQLRVIVVDNASTDETESCCVRWRRRIEDFQYVKNPENIGAVLNVIKCFELAETDYCWIIGDDDVVRLGVLQRLIKLLATHRPALVHLNGIGFHDKPESGHMAYTGKIEAQLVSGLDFARLVNVYTTFISGMIVNKAAFLAGGKMEDHSLIKDTLFPQLNWVLKNMQEEGTLIYIPQQLILTRIAASGGYNLYRSFSIDLVRMIDHGLSPRLGNALKRRTVLLYLPGLIMSVRADRIGSFDIRPEERRFFRQSYARYPLYWLLVEPILYFPLPIATRFLGLCNQLSRLQRIADHIRVRIKTRLAHEQIFA